MQNKQLEELIVHLSQGKKVTGGSDYHELMYYYANEAMRITARLNNAYHTPEEIRKIMEELTGRHIDESFIMFPPFYTDFGKNIHIGRNVFINCGCCFQDQGGIFIEDGALIGHNVVIATINHGQAPEDRSSNYPAPVHIGKKVWIGANAAIMPGTSIGENAIIAAGAVVSHNVESNTIVGGVPARFIKYIEN